MIDGVTVAGMIGKDPSQVFKTLISKSRSGAYYVFVLPAAKRAEHEKSR